MMIVSYTKVQGLRAESWSVWTYLPPLHLKIAVSVVRFRPWAPYFSIGYQISPKLLALFWH